MPCPSHRRLPIQRRWLYTGSDARGFSLADPNCFYQFTHTHELGHNLGCYHDRDNSNTETTYAHAYRYCTGADR